MADEVVSVEKTGCLGRLGSAIIGIPIGLMMFIAAFPLLIWNEGRAVNTHRALEEGAANVVHVEAGTVDPSHEGDLVHLTGDATATSIVADPDLGVSLTALALEREVEMYQWKENKETKKKKKIGGGEERVTTYSYEKVWSDDLVRSSGFHEKTGHQNPAELPLQELRVDAPSVSLGAFTLSTELVKEMNSWTEVPTTNDTLALVSDGWKARVKLDGARYFVGADPAAPQVGDVRISFRALQPAQVSVLAKQSGSGLGAFTTSQGVDVSDLTMGNVPADEMFAAAQSANSVLTWVLRVGGYFLMFLGLFTVGRPITVVADVLPFAGTLVTFAIGGLAFFAAGVCTLPTIAVAWIAYRPILAVGLILVAVLFAVAVIGGAFGLWRMAAARKAAAA